MAFYEMFADSYDDMINWSSRLEREERDLKKIVSENKIKTCVDAGCGTGVHAITLARMGVKVLGIDNSQPMLDIAIRNAQKQKLKNVEFKIGEFVKLDKSVKGPVDAIFCLGNSLPHLVDDLDIITALGQFHKLLKPGGLCLIQMVNFDHYLDSSDSAVAVVDGIRKGREVTFRRHYEFKGTKVIFHVSIYDSRSRELLEDYSSPLNAIRRDLLETFMEKAGFDDIQMYFDFSKQPLKRDDRSVTIFAWRPKD